MAITSQGEETVDETVARAKELVPQQTLQVSANSLTNPPRAQVLTEPSLGPDPRTGTATAVASDLDNIITAQTQEAADLRQKRAEFAQLGDLGTLGDFRSDQMEEFGVPENLRQLKDIQLQLADIDTGSELTKTRIEGAAGQTLGQAQREVTQEDRENAVRRSGLAAQASVLQGNIKTATSLVNDAVTTAYQDRTLKNNNLLNQINDLSGTVDDQTQQLLDAEKARIEADQAAVKEVKDAVNSAMESGAATADEVAQLTDINATDESRLALAQSITARGATEDRGLTLAGKRASIAATRAAMSLNERKFEYQKQQDKLELELETLVEDGTLTKEEAADKQKVEQALQLKELMNSMVEHPGFAASVGSPSEKIKGSGAFALISPIPGIGGGIEQAHSFLSGEKAGFNGIFDQVVEGITVDQLSKMSGPKTDKDIEILRSAAVRLSKSTTEAEFLAVKAEMDRTLDRVIDSIGETPSQTQFYHGVDEVTFNEASDFFDTAGGSIEDAQFPSVLSPTSLFTDSVAF